MPRQLASRLLALVRCHVQRNVGKEGNQQPQNSPLLTRAEREQVKQVAKELLVTLKAEWQVLDWRKRQQTRAMVQLAIEVALDKLLPVYTEEMYEHKCAAVYQHVYDSYYGEGKRVYLLAV